MKFILRQLTIALIVLVLFMLITVLLLGWGVAGGSLLLRFTRLDFTLFEATLLHLLAVLFIIFVISQVILYVIMSTLVSGPPLPPLNNDEDEYEEEDDDEDYPISLDRFLVKSGWRPDEALVHYRLANAVNMELEETLPENGRITRQHREDLAIRLAELIVTILKRKRGGRGRTPKISMAALKQQMTRTEQRPYDDDILRAAVAAANNLFEEDEEWVQILGIRGRN
jgi:hypothetical protein